MQVSTEVVAASIALTGVLLSLSISLIISRKTVEVELSKLRLQFKGTYTEELLRKRIQVYPSLYSHLAAYVRKSISFERTPETVGTLLRSLAEWDLENAVFLSRTSIKHFIDLQNYLIALTSNSAKLSRLTESRYFDDDDLVKLIGKLQLAIRGDLGIYGFDFSTSGDEGLPITPERWHE